jgi:hypothetical protein
LGILEDWLNNLEPVDDCRDQTVMHMITEEVNYEESLKDFSREAELINTIVLRHVAEDERKYQPEEQLGEVGLEPTQREMELAALSNEEAEQQFSEETIEMNSIVEWTLSATEGKEDDMGYHYDLPIYQKKVQQRRLHGHRQPLQKLDEVVEDIRRLMLRSVDTASRERMGKEEATVAIE